MKAYYGRCMSIYGTAREIKDIKLIQGLGYEVIPFPPQEELNIKKALGENVMETVFKPLVQSADVMFFRAVRMGNEQFTKVTAGVAAETQWAYDKKIPILELPSDIKSRTISIEATRAYLREVGQR